MMLVAAGILSTGLVAHAATVIVLLQARCRIAPVLLHVLSAALWFGLQIVALAKCGALAYIWHAGAFFAFGAMAFLFAFSAVYKSISLRMLVLLERSPGRELEFRELHERVVMRAFRERAELLRNAGVVEFVDGRLDVTELGQRILRRLRILRGLFGARESGIYYREPALRAGENGKARR